MLMVSFVYIPEEFNHLDQQYWVDSFAQNFDLIPILVFVIIDLQLWFFLCCFSLNSSTSAWACSSGRTSDSYFVIQKVDSVFWRKNMIEIRLSCAVSYFVNFQLFPILFQRYLILLEVLLLSVWFLLLWFFIRMQELNLKVQFIRHDGFKYASDELGICEHPEFPKWAWKLCGEVMARYWMDILSERCIRVYKSSK